MKKKYFYKSKNPTVRKSITFASSVCLNLSTNIVKSAIDYSVSECRSPFSSSGQTGEMLTRLAACLLSHLRSACHHCWAYNVLNRLILILILENKVRSEFFICLISTKTCCWPTLILNILLCTNHHI